MNASTVSDTRRILVVEDEAVVALDIAESVRRLGHEVIATTAMAESAVEIAAEEQPDLILMDVRLKGPMDGIEAGRQIGSTWGLPVIYLTAHADRDTVARARETMPYGYLLKPFDEKKLRVALELALARHASEEAAQRHSRDLNAVLDCLPMGALLIEKRGALTYANAAAREMLDLSDPRPGDEWQRTLPLPAPALEELRREIAAPPTDRSRVTTDDGEGRRTLQIEVADDPRDDHGWILFVHDVSEVEALRAEIDRGSEFERMIGRSDGMQRVFQWIDDLSRVDSSVLILGETGTGKELVARALHRRSDRSGKPFVPVNCAGLSDELAASQLFGHARGSFTGAIDDRQGHFEAADGGVLFLDEIVELSDRVQAGLLRVLEERRVQRLGESHDREVDVRLVAATNRNLEQEVRAGRFRADLYYRVRVAQIDLPPLRHRREDLPLLIDRFVHRGAATAGKSVRSMSDDARDRCLDYDWPGNIRELRNAVEFAVLRCRGETIEVRDLPPEIVAAPPPGIEAETEPERIQLALARTRGNRMEAARLLGMSRATFYRRLKEHGIDPDEPVSQAGAE